MLEFVCCQFCFYYVLVQGLGLEERAWEWKKWYSSSILRMGRRTEKHPDFFNIPGPGQDIYVAFAWSRNRYEYIDFLPTSCTLAFAWIWKAFISPFVLTFWGKHGKLFFNSQEFLYRKVAKPSTLHQSRFFSPDSHTPSGLNNRWTFRINALPRVTTFTSP